MKKRLRLAGYLVTGAYAVLCLITGIMLAEFSLKRLRRPLQAEYVRLFQERIASHGATSLDVSVRAADGAVLRGWLVRPRNPNGSAVILFHGVTDNRLGIAGFGEIFLKQGYSLLLPDARGHGESGGELSSYGLLEADDVSKWMDLLLAANPRACVYGFGESMGAGIVMQSLRVETRFCGVIAESGFAEFREAAYDRLGEKFDVGPWFGRTVLRPAIEVGLLHAELRYKLDLGDASSRKAVASSSVPVLLIHGEEDKNIRPRNGDLIHAAAPHNTELWKVPKAAHCGAWATAGKEFERRVVEWFATHTTRCDLGRCRL